MKEMREENYDESEHTVSSPQCTSLKKIPESRISNHWTQKYITSSLLYKFESIS